MSTIQSTSSLMPNSIINQASSIEVKEATSHSTQENIKPETIHKPVLKDKTAEYAQRAENLIKSAQRFAEAKNSVEMVKSTNKDSLEVQGLKKEIDIALAKKDKAFSALSEHTISDFKDVFQLNDVIKDVTGQSSTFKTENKAYTALKDSITCQQNFINSLTDLSKKIGQTPSLDKLILQENKKHAELLNLVISLHSKQAELQGSVVENLNFINKDGKNNVQALQNLIQKDLSALFAKFDMIPPGAFPEEATYILDQMAEDIETIEAKLQSVSENGNYIGTITGANGKEQTVSVSHDLISSLKDSLENAKNRVISLKDPHSIVPAKNLLNAMFIEIPMDSYNALTQGKAPMKKLLQQINQLHNDVIECMNKKQALPTLKDLKSLVKSNTGLASYVKITSQMMKIDGSTLTEKEKNSILKLCGLPANTPLTDTLKNLIKELGTKLNAFVFSLLDNKETELIEYEFLTRAPKPEIRGEYIKLAFEHNLDLVSIVEASSRGIPPELIETLPSAHMQIQFLGAGGVNTVLKCTCLDANASKTELVFKPELNARNGLFKLANQHLGYEKNMLITQLNMVSQDAAILLGCKKSIASTKAGTVNGNFGMFMELVPGNPVISLKGNVVVGEKANGQKVKAGNLIGALQESEMLVTARRSLKRELNNLSWIDALTGQGDRHMGNFMISLDIPTGKVRITGIDNDSCFSKALIGPATIDHNKVDPDIRNSFIKNIPEKAKIYDKNNKWVAVNVEELPRAKQDLLGLNSNLEKPTFIDKTTYDHLMAIQADEYRKLLESRNIPEPMIVSALLRLENCQAHAKKLADNNSVIDFDTPEPSMEEYMCLATGEMDVRGMLAF